MPTGNADARHANPYLVQMPAGGPGLLRLFQSDSSRLAGLTKELTEVNKQIAAAQAQNNRLQDRVNQARMSTFTKQKLPQTIYELDKKIGGLYTKKRELENKISFLENELQTPVPSASSGAGCSCASGAAVKSNSRPWFWKRG